MQVENSLNGACKECDAKCCRNYVVAVTAYDLVRLLEKTGSLECIEAIRANRVEIQYAHSFFLFENNLPEEFILSLRRDNSETCVFLGKSNFCSVYGFRPMTCRVYPFQKVTENDITYKQRYRCPVNWKLDEYSKNQFLKDIERHEKELRDHSKWCREWNATLASRGNLSMFLEFMVSKVKETGSL